MAGGLINIVSYGSQDLYLTGAPEISYFKTSYRRYTNFAMESFDIPFDDDFNFDKENTLTVPRLGDLIHKSCLKITLPETSFERIVYVSDINNANNSAFIIKFNFLIPMIIQNVK